MSFICCNWKSHFRSKQIDWVRNCVSPPPISMHIQCGGSIWIIIRKCSKMLQSRVHSLPLYFPSLTAENSYKQIMRIFKSVAEKERMKVKKEIFASGHRWCDVMWNSSVKLNMIECRLRYQTMQAAMQQNYTNVWMGRRRLEYGENYKFVAMHQKCVDVNRIDKLGGESRQQSKEDICNSERLKA